MNKKFRQKEIYFYMIGKDIIYEGTALDISKESGIPLSTLRNLFYTSYNYKKIFKKNKGDYKRLILENDLSEFLDDNNYDPKVFCLYKGDKLITIGTIKEISEFTGINEKMVYYYGTNRYKNTSKGNKRILVQLDNE